MILDIFDCDLEDCIEQGFAKLHSFSEERLTKFLFKEALNIVKRTHSDKKFKAAIQALLVYVNNS